MRVVKAWLVVLAFAFILAGCRGDPNIKFIQGIWQHEEQHISQASGESWAITSWIFDNGVFVSESCCITSSVLEGKYRTLESEGDNLTLELYEITGLQGSMVIPTDTTTSIEVSVDRENDTIKVGNIGPFKRMTPQNMGN